MSTDPKKGLERAGNFFAYKEKVEALLHLSQQLASMGFEKDWTDIGEIESVDIGGLIDEIRHAYPDKLVRIQIELQPKPQPTGLFDLAQASQMHAK